MCLLKYSGWRILDFWWDQIGSLLPGQFVQLVDFYITGKYARVKVGTETFIDRKEEPEIGIRRIQGALEKIFGWYEEWKIAMNAETRKSLFIKGEKRNLVALRHLQIN